MIRDSSVDWETDIYQNGRQINRYPFDAVVSFFLKNYSAPARQDTKVLEIGCGTGNNLKFLLENGFDAWGVDYSETGVDLCNSFLAQHKLPKTAIVGDLAGLPIKDKSIDVVLDRACLTQNSYMTISRYLSEIGRILKPGGVLACFTLYGEEHPDKSFGTEIERNCFDYFEDGYFKNVGLTSFFNYEEIKKLFSDFKSLDIQRIVKFTQKGMIVSDEYSVIASV